MTRQPILTTVQLPSTNYVLKRLITSWKEQHPEISQEYASSYETPKNSFQRSTVKEVYPGPTTPQRNIDDYISKRSKIFTQAVVATLPTSVISQAAVETIINSVKPHIACLCTSEKLQECEAAVLEMAKIWKDLKGNHALHPFLSQPTMVNGFIEILSASMDREVLRTSIYILSELIYADESVGETCTSLDSDLDCLASLLKNGLAEPAVLIYQLRPVFVQILAHDLIPSLAQLLQSKNEESDDLQLVIDPKDAALSILEQLLIRGDENSRSINALSVISANGIPILVKYLDRPEGRRSIVSILLCCMQAEKTCRNLIANRIELSHVLEQFHNGSDGVRGICVELVQLNRRTFCNQILQMIKDEGAFSTMHTFLVYLQMAPMEQKPAIATLLLQIDLLVEASKMSIYREESIEGLIESLRMTDYSNSQMMALDALLCLTGRITSSGESYTEVWLLKLAGFDQQYLSESRTAKEA